MSIAVFCLVDLTVEVRAVVKCLPNFCVWRCRLPQG